MAKQTTADQKGIEVTGQHPVNVFNNPHGYYTGNGGTEAGTAGSTVDATKPEFNDGQRIPAVGQRGNATDTGEYQAQLVPYKFHRKGILDIYKDMVWQQICSDTTGLNAHSGTKIKGYRYLPLIDPRNINDQGIDATGVQVEEGNLLLPGATDPGAIDLNKVMLGEFGGRVNRVGFSRTEYEGDIKDYGFFWEWSRDSMFFDSDPELYSNFVKLSMEAANQIVEYQIQEEVLMKGATKVYANGNTVEGVTGKLTYQMLMDMYDKLYENRVPEQTKIIKGSKLTDTKVAGNGYFIYVPHKMTRQVTELTDKADGTGNKVFVGVEHYAYSGVDNMKNDAAMGEIGKIGPFRFIKVRNMTQAKYLDGTTKKVVAKDGVYPLVVVGEEAIKAITLHTNSKGKGRWEVIVKKPGYVTADRHDPFGKTGFYSIQWWFGLIAQRPERIVIGYAKA